MERATWCGTPAEASATRRLRPEVWKNSSTALSSNEGELARSITTCVPAMASLRPWPVMVLTPVLGEAATTSWPPWRRMATVLEPIRPVPPITTIFIANLLVRSPQAGVCDGCAASRRSERTDKHLYDVDAPTRGTLATPRLRSMSASTPITVRTIRARLQTCRFGPPAILPDDGGCRTPRPAPLRLRWLGRGRANHRHVPLVEVLEGRGRLLSSHPARGDFPGVRPLLHGHLGNTGQGLAVPARPHRQVADHEDLGMTGDREVFADQDPTRLVGRRIHPLRQGLREGRHRHAARPENGPRFHALGRGSVRALEQEAFLVDLLDQNSRLDLHAELDQGARRLARQDF